MAKTDIPMVVAKGDDQIVGLQIGKHFKKEIKSFLINDSEKLPLKKNNLERIMTPYKEYLMKKHINIYNEILGLSKGADISLEDALKLQFRRELSRKAALDCSTFAIHSKGILAQTIDLNGNIGNYGNVIKIEKEDGQSQLIYSFSGLLGYLGINSSGVAIGINMVFALPWQVGISPYLLIRELLALGSVDECLTYIKNVKIASSRSLTIIDSQQLINIEIDPTKEISIIKKDMLCHTNHFVHEKMIKAEKFNIFSVNSSKIRHKRLITLVKNNMLNIEDIDTNQIHEIIFDKILSDHHNNPFGICNHVEKDGYPKTVGGIVMDIKNKVLHVRKGRICSAKTHTFSFQ